MVDVSHKPDYYAALSSINAQQVALIVESVQHACRQYQVPTNAHKNVTLFATPVC